MMKADGFGGCFGGCFFVRASRTVSAFQGSTRLLSFSGLPFPSLSVSLKTAFTLPCIISLANLLAVSCVGCWPLWCTRVVDCAGFTHQVFKIPLGPEFQTALQVGEKFF